MLMAARPRHFLQQLRSLAAQPRSMPHFSAAVRHENEWEEARRRSSSSSFSGVPGGLSSTTSMRRAEDEGGELVLLLAAASSSMPCRRSLSLSEAIMMHEKNVVTPPAAAGCRVDWEPRSSG